MLENCQANGPCMWPRGQFFESKPREGVAGAFRRIRDPTAMTLSLRLGLHRGIGSSAIRKPVQATNPESVYSRNVLSLSQCEREQRAPAGRRNNPPAMRQQTVN